MVSDRAYTGVRIGLVLLFVLITLHIASCASKFMAFDEHGKRIEPPEDYSKYGATPFEQSVGSSEEELGRLNVVRHYIMFELLKGLAEHDGRNSDQHRLFEEVCGLDIIMDSARVADIFHIGLMELDQDRFGDTDNSFIKHEVTRRAEQIIQYHSFHPETLPHFDELGRLILYHGEFTLEGLGQADPTSSGPDDMTFVVSFVNGVYYRISEDDSYDHRIEMVGFNEAEVSTIEGEKQATDSSEVRVLEMEQEGKVAVPVDYDQLSFATINLHSIPCGGGDGKWNGRMPPEGEGSWDYRRAFLDFYMNLAEMGFSENTPDQIIDLTITYEVFHNSYAGHSLIATDTMDYRRTIPAVESNDGIAFRVFTHPFFTGSTQQTGSYQVNLRVAYGEKFHIAKYPLHIEPRVHELLVLDPEGAPCLGIPACQRIPRAKPGDSLSILVPVCGLPWDAVDSAFCGLVEVYLSNNENLGNARVITGDLSGFAFADSADSKAPDFALPDTGSPRRTAPPLIAVVDARASSSDTYILCRVEIPKVLPDGSEVVRGKYSVGAVVKSGDRVISEAVMSDLRMK